MSTPVSGSGSSTSSSGSTTSSQQLAQQEIQALLQQSSQPAVSFGGLVSGINTQQIVQALLAADQAPLIQMQAQQAQEQAKLVAWQDVNSKLQAMQAAADTLSLQATVSARKVTFAGASGSFATAVATPSASNGSFQLQIDQLATATAHLLHDQPHGLLWTLEGGDFVRFVDRGAVGFGGGGRGR